jgi:hypothetical protein
MPIFVEIEEELKRETFRSTIVKLKISILILELLKDKISAKYYSMLHLNEIKGKSDLYIESTCSQLIPLFSIEENVIRGIL